MTDIRKLTLRWFEEVWTKKRLSAVDDLTSPDVVAELVGVNQPLGQEDLLVYCDALASAVPDIRIRVHATTVEDNRVVTEWQVRGRHTGPGLGIPPTGVPLVISGFSSFIWDQGVIVSGRDRWDRAKLLADLTAARADDLKRRFGLTPRESEVELLLVERRTHKEIARGLGIRPNTARRHSEHVLRKLKITSRSDVAEVLGLPSGLQIPEHGTDLNE